ncbi:acyl-CoA ligase (AMP-forming), exosortase A system-associated [Oxalobacteraceae bacterium]|nr:acyl-CoA ligase (AMP-forming), exosortase A system-associated [Oxalobacteraceae bacterium]
MAQLLHDLIFKAALRTPDAPALRYQGVAMSYRVLAQLIGLASRALPAQGLARGERVAVYLEKREEAVLAMFGAAAAGVVFVPVNPLLKPDQVAYILADCNARLLITSGQRHAQLAGALARCPELHSVVLVDATDTAAAGAVRRLLRWSDFLDSGGPARAHRSIDTDMAAILYTSGSTGMPKGVVLSHRNLVAGAHSVASYLNNSAADRLLCVLPFSFDYGLSQLSTAFDSGACAVLINYLLPRDIINTVESEQISGLAAVPPLWMQLAQLSWPSACTLRYLSNSGGTLPRQTIAALRHALPQTKIYLMYGLTEAFRSTYLAPEQVDQRPDSIGKAIPNAEVLVLRADGSPCAPGEPGELVHRGALVAQGYWNDAQRTAERFRPLPGRAAGLPLAELAVWSGDTVRSDEEGYLYFIGRGDDMIKTSGYRVSPGEVEQIAYASGLVAEAAAIGIPHPRLGQAIVMLVKANEGQALDAAQMLAACQAALPMYMVPAWIDVRQQALPRNPNGKIDRRLLADELRHLFAEAS